MSDNISIADVKRNPKLIGKFDISAEHKIFFTSLLITMKIDLWDKVDVIKEMKQQLAEVTKERDQYKGLCVIALSYLSESDENLDYASWFKAKLEHVGKEWITPEMKNNISNLLAESQ